MVSQGCTEMALVSRVKEQELQMLFLCHLHLTVMSLLHLFLSHASQSDRCGGLSELALAQSAAKAPIACLLSDPFLFVCLVLPEGRSHNNPGKSIHGFKVTLV